MTCGLLGLQKLDVMLFSPGKITPGWFFCHSVNERPAVYDIVIKELALQCVWLQGPTLSIHVVILCLVRMRGKGLFSMCCAHRKSLSFSVATGVPLLPDIRQSALPWSLSPLLLAGKYFLCAMAFFVLMLPPSAPLSTGSTGTFLASCTDEVAELYVSASFPLFFCAGIIFQALPCDYSFHSTFCLNSVSPQCFSTSA